MKHLLSLLLILPLLGVGCTAAEIPTDDAAEIIEEPVVEETLEDEVGQIYVQFVQNVHDFVYPEKSIETLNRVIDLHEMYKLPVELHVTDTVMQKYVELAPDLIERFKTSEFVSISYHVRPPHPIYNGFDIPGITNMSSQERYETLLAYEEHELDMQTGGYTDAPGGYQFVKDTIGYPPRIVGQTTGANGKEYSRILEEKGARFTVLHENGSKLEDMVHGLHKRPEDTEVKLYEFQLSNYDIKALFAQWTEDARSDEDFFVNLKFHENNYYLTNTPFAPIYWEDWNSGRRHPYDPPFDLTKSQEHIRLKSPKIQEEKWTVYEQALEYVSQNTDWLTAINAEDLERMVDSLN